jgi:hypothetical protein
VLEILIFSKDIAFDCLNRNCMFLLCERELNGEPLRVKGLDERKNSARVLVGSSSVDVRSVGERYDRRILLCGI